MTREELAALLAEETHTFTCGACGGHWITPTPESGGPALLYHACPQARTPTESPDWRTPRHRHDDERHRWATELFGALEAAVGPDALLRGDPDTSDDQTEPEDR